MPLIVPKAIATASANLIRGTALSQFASWRPFAYKFDSKASILSVDSVKEDPISIHSAFSSLFFDKDSEDIGTLFSEFYSINGEFSSKHLMGNSVFKVIGDAKLLTSLTPITLQVYYIYDSGHRTVEENRDLLDSDSNLVIFSSRHTRLEEISYILDPRPDGDVEVKFTCSDPEIIANSCRKLADMFKGAV